MAHESGLAVRGSYIVSDWELRITGRCLEEDLELRPDTPFATVEQLHPIVRALVNKRRPTTGAGKTVGPANGEWTFYHLGHGDDHRGATWYDADERVVWLCAHGLHRSRDPDDAFKNFEVLRGENRLYPTEPDYERLFMDRLHRFLDRLPQDARELLEKATGDPGAEVSGILGGETEMAVLVDVVETLEETFLAFMMKDIDQPRLESIVAAFFPDIDRHQPWDFALRLPTRILRDGEACLRFLHDRS